MDHRVDGPMLPRRRCSVFRGSATAPFHPLAYHVPFVRSPSSSPAFGVRLDTLPWLSLACRPAGSAKPRQFGAGAGILLVHYGRRLTSPFLTGDGRRFRVLPLIDDFSRKCSGIEAATSMSGTIATRVLDEVASASGYPEVLTRDNGPELCRSKHL